MDQTVSGWSGLTTLIRQEDTGVAKHRTIATGSAQLKHMNIEMRYVASGFGKPSTPCCAKEE
jgi:hypothetical protein